MKHVALVLLTLLLLGCPAPADAPVTVSRGGGVEAISSQTVVIVPIIGDRDKVTSGTRTQRALVNWLKTNPEATIRHMSVVGYRGHPQEIVLIVEGKLKSEPETK